MSRRRSPSSASTPHLPGWFVALLALVPVAFLAAFYAWPFLTLLGETASTDAARDVLSSSRTWRTIWFTTWMAGTSTIATIALGLPATYVTARFAFPGRAALIGLLTAVFVLPTVVMGAAMLAVLPDGLDRSVVAVVAAHVVFNLAVVVRTVGAAWEVVPRDLELAAATLGASRFRVLRHVVLPILAPAITATATIVFVLSFTSFGVIRVLAAPGTRTIEVEIWRRATQLGDVGGAGVLAVVQLALLGVVVAAASVVQRRTTRTLRTSTRPHRGPPRTRHDRVVVGAVAGLTAAAALVPLLAMAVQSLSTRDGWSIRAWRNLGATEVRPGISLGIDPGAAIRASLVNAAWATLIAVTVGALCSLAIAAARRSGRLLDVGAALPLATSAVTIGFGILLTFDVAPVDWRGSWWLVPVGQALVALPFVVRATSSTLGVIDPDLTHAAWTLGADRVRAWGHVVVPHLWRPLAAGAGLAAAISLGEFGATSLLSRRGDETMPIAIERMLGRTGSLVQAQGYALATILAAVTIVLVVASDAAARRGDRLLRRADRSGS